MGALTDFMAMYENFKNASDAEKLAVAEDALDFAKVFKGARLAPSIAEMKQALSDYVKEAKKQQKLVDDELGEVAQVPKEKKAVEKVAKEPKPKAVKEQKPKKSYAEFSLFGLYEEQPSVGSQVSAVMPEPVSQPEEVQSEPTVPEHKGDLGQTEVVEVPEHQEDPIETKKSVSESEASITLEEISSSAEEDIPIIEESEEVPTVSSAVSDIQWSDEEDEEEEDGLEEEQTHAVVENDGLAEVALDQPQWSDEEDETPVAPPVTPPSTN